CILWRQSDDGKYAAIVARCGICGHAAGHAVAPRIQAGARGRRRVKGALERELVTLPRPEGPPRWHRRPQRLKVQGDFEATDRVRGRCKAEGPYEDLAARVRVAREHLVVDAAVTETVVPAEIELVAGVRRRGETEGEQGARREPGACAHVGFPRG